MQTDGLSEDWITTRLADSSRRDKKLRRTGQRRGTFDHGSKVSGSKSIIFVGSMTILVSSQQQTQ